MTDDRMKTVGLISDTHGDVPDSAAEALTAAGVALIVHAGDIGGAHVLLELEAIAPIVAVRGNTDHGAWAEALPGTARASVNGVRIAVAHGAGPGVGLGGAEVVVGGHTHVPSIVRYGGVLYVNPGSATRPRSRDGAPTIAVLDIGRPGDVRARIIALR